MYKLAVFDLDGTLLNTQPDLLPAFNKAVTAYGYTPCPPDRFGKAIGNGFQTSLRRILPPDFDNEEQFQDMCRIYHETYSAHYADQTYPYAGIRDTLRVMAQMGVKVAVLSNKTEEHSLVLCHKLLPDIPFCGIYGAGNGYPLKPNPTYLNKIIASHTQTPAEAVFIGDSDVDVFTAHNAGISCIGCAWGYRGAEELQHAGADVIAHKPKDILNFIK